MRLEERPYLPLRLVEEQLDTLEGLWGRRPALVLSKKIEPAALLGDVGIATVPLYLGLAAQLGLADTVIAVVHSIGEAAAFATLKAG